MLNITNNIDSLRLSRAEALALELKLNVSSKKHLWKTIGDQLYDYHIGRRSSGDVVVANDQMEFLKKLHAQPSWKECGDL